MAFKDIKRIQFCSCAGTGKTTICEYLEKNMNIPFISVQTKDIMCKYPHCLGHKELINCSCNYPEESFKMQKELAEKRLELLKNYPSYKPYCMDRSLIDNYVYFLLHDSKNQTEEICKEFKNLMLESLQYADYIILLTLYNNRKISYKDTRISNYYFQKMVEYIFQGVIGDILNHYPEFKHKFHYIEVKDDIKETMSLINNVVFGI